MRAHPFVSSQPRVFIPALLIAALLAWQALAPAAICVCVAGATHSTPPAASLRAKDSQPLFHCIARHPQKKTVASLHTAERSAPGVEFLFPRSGSPGVMCAGIPRNPEHARA